MILIVVVVAEEDSVAGSKWTSRWQTDKLLWLTNVGYLR